MIGQEGQQFLNRKDNNTKRIHRENRNDSNSRKMRKNKYMAENTEQTGRAENTEMIGTQSRSSIEMGKGLE